MFSNKEKTYKSNMLGRTMAIIDKQLGKQQMINNIMSGVIMLALLGFGLLSKEYLLLYLTSKAIGIATDILIK